MQNWGSIVHEMYLIDLINKYTFLNLVLNLYCQIYKIVHRELRTKVKPKNYKHEKKENKKTGSTRHYRKFGGIAAH